MGARTEEEGCTLGRDIVGIFTEKSDGDLIVLTAEAPEALVEVGLETMEDADRLRPSVVETNKLVALLTVNEEFS